MKPTRRQIDLGLAFAAAAMGIASMFVNDVDKSPLYFLLAYVLWRLGLQSTARSLSQNSQPTADEPGRPDRPRDLVE